ncbi:MAG: hypothetical protein R2724_19155 [Bryobacterales bacterium]
MHSKVLKNVAAMALAVAMTLSAQGNGNRNGNGNGNGNGSSNSGSNGVPFQGLQSQIDQIQLDLDTALAAIQSQIDALEGNQQAQGALIDALNTAVFLLESRVTQNETDIAALEALSATQAQLITALQSQLTAAETRITANEDDIAALIAADQLLHQLIAALEDRVGTLETQVAQNTSDIAALQADLAAVQQQLLLVQQELALKQNRVNGVCGTGSAIRQINSDGTVACEAITGGGGGGGTFNSLSVNRGAIIGAGGVMTLSEFCPSGSKTTGAGYESTTNTNMVVYEIQPNSNIGWDISFRNTSTGSQFITIYVMCGPVL